MSAKLYEKMNLYLANQEVSYIKLHNLHWYVKGRGFFTLHTKLESLYDQTAEIIDQVAERLLALDQSPIANLKKAMSVSTVTELKDAPISSEETAKLLLGDTDAWIRDTAEIISLAEEANDAGSADLFTGYLSEYQKLRWMLKAYSA